MTGGYTIGDMPEHDPAAFAFEQSADDEPWRVTAPSIEDSGREVEFPAALAGRTPGHAKQLADPAIGVIEPPLHLSTDNIQSGASHA